jgi:hypothetical protein
MEATLSPSAEKGSGNGQFIRPTGIAVDGEGNVAAYDINTYRVQVHRV